MNLNEKKDNKYRTPQTQKLREKDTRSTSPFTRFY